jgi:hypothetical protein
MLRSRTWKARKGSLSHSVLNQGIPETLGIKMVIVEGKIIPNHPRRRRAPTAISPPLRNPSKVPQHCRLPRSSPPAEFAICRRNIAYRHGPGNQFQRLFLDRCLANAGPHYSGVGDTLEQAQTHKFDRICRKLGAELAVAIETQRSPARTNRIRLSPLQDIGMQPAKGRRGMPRALISEGQIALGKSTGEVHATQQPEAGAALSEAALPEVALPEKDRRDVEGRRSPFYYGGARWMVPD